MDLTATCLAAAGVAPAPGYPLDGVDLLPVLLFAALRRVARLLDYGDDVRGGPTGMRCAVSASSISYSEVARWLSAFRTYSSRSNS